MPTKKSAHGEARVNLRKAAGLVGGGFLERLVQTSEGDAIEGELGSDPIALKRLARLAGEAPLTLRWGAASDAAALSITSALQGERLGRRNLGGEWVREATKWALDDHFNLGHRLAAIADAALTNAALKSKVQMTVVAIGEYARGEIGPECHCRALLFVSDEVRMHEALAASRRVQTSVRDHDALFPIVVRLGMEDEGPVIATPRALKAYDFEFMSMHERFRLGSARTVCGDPSFGGLVSGLAYALPLTPERLQALLGAKRHEENEVEARYRRRDVVRGQGGLDDIEWLVHVHELHYPTATRAGTNLKTVDRIRALARAHLVNTVEAEELCQAFHHLTRLRNRLSLFGVHPNLPENPNRLDQLANLWKLPDGNAFLAQHERTVDTVRTILVEGLERL